jgi:AcrR family transcriptional regulator
VRIKREFRPDELDFTKAALYYYVQDKQDVLFRIFLQTLEMALETVEEIVHSAMTPPEKLRTFIDRQVRMIAEHPELFTVYFDEKVHLAAERAGTASDKEHGRCLLRGAARKEGL